MSNLDLGRVPDQMIVRSVAVHPDDTNNLALEEPKWSEPVDSQAGN